ncbi:tyrosine-type recombinase/integrase [Rudanella lutea]|uniref:tyrosine-type recombinase/integrase n=1 Tax=Rudanella lutea TaxID=451374 RepID=UPI000366830E
MRATTTLLFLSTATINFRTKPTYTHLLKNGTGIKFIQDLLGHNDIKTTLRYTQVSEKNLKNIKSPLDRL